MIPLLAALGGITGIANYASQRGQANRDTDLAAATAKYSPWTGLKPQQVNNPSFVGDILGGVGSGAALGQGVQSANTFNDYLKAQTAKAAAGGGAAAAMAVPAPSATGGATSLVSQQNPSGQNSGGLSDLMSFLGGGGRRKPASKSTWATMNTGMENK